MMVEAGEPVRVLGIVGSPRKGNTEMLVKEALRSARGLGEKVARVASLVKNSRRGK